MINVKVKKLLDNAILPTRGSDHAAGYDLYAIEDHNLQPMSRKLFKTGISMSIPQKMYGRIAPRSGLAYNHGLDVLAGVIDEDYRGDVGVILINFGESNVEIKIGDKIAQIIFENYNPARLTVVDDLDSTERGKGGFGSTDKKELNTLLAGMEQPTMENIESPIDKGSTIAKLYKESGGIPIKQRYADEIKKEKINANLK